MSQRDFSEQELEGTSELPIANKALFLQRGHAAATACQNGDFETAVLLYTEALQLDPGNYILYSNRSAARLKQGQFSLALQDAIKARELCPNWPKAYFRQGVALQCLGRYGEALASFSMGLPQDENNTQLLGGLIEAALKSPLRSSFEPVLQQLRAMNLDQSPFVVISVVGQELLQLGEFESAVTVLESALRIGSTSLKLRGSVFSALSSAHWALNNLNQAISYMQQDLGVSKSLGDTPGECRAHGNLGSAYFSQGSFKEALTAHRYQLVLAMKCKDTQAAANALTSLGHVYTATGDYPNALASHKQCVQLVKQIGDRLQEAREIGNVGAVYLAMGEFDSALSCHNYHLTLAKKLGNKVEEARAYSNLGSSHHYKRNFSQAIAFHEQVLRIAKHLGDRNVELSYKARAYAGLGHAARCAGDLQKAKMWHEKQLEMALAGRDKVGEGRACSNLGIVYQLLGQHDGALKLHQAHLTIARQLQDRAGMGRAYGNIGNAYSASGLYEQAIKYHKQELIISKEVNDRAAEASTHGNLAVAWQALGAFEYAYIHYKAHLNLSRELKDTGGEAVSLLNLANCLSSRQEFGQAVPYYEQYLMLSQELGDVAAEGKACHFLGYAHYCLGNYREAVRYYDQDLSLAKDLQDKMNMGRAYCNLGLAHLALGNIQASLESQKYFLAVAHMTNHLPSKFRALGNIGDIFIRTGETEEGVKMYQKQLELSRQSRERLMEAAACGALGLAHRLLKKFDKALGYHTQELTLRQEMTDLPGECKAHAHLGSVLMALGNYTHAVKCYQEQLERAQELQDLAKEAQAFGNLGIAKLNMGHYEEAIGHLEQQMGTLEQISTPTTQHDKARALGHLGDCYDSLGDYEEGIKCHNRHLKLAISLQSFRDQERAYKGLARDYRSLGNLKEALVCFEKRLVVSHELGHFEAKAAAYGDLGSIHSALENYEQALNCLEHQRQIALELDNKITLSNASSALGNVLMEMGNSEESLKVHKSDLDMSETLENCALQSRACGNLGTVYETLKEYNEAVKYFEKQLSLATDRLSKAFACLSLGRAYNQINETAQSINYLRQGLAITQSLNKSEEEAKIRYQLGLALKCSNDIENSRTQLETAAQILESLRMDQRLPEEKKILFNLQTSCYHILQQILTQMSKNDEALIIAERCKSRVTNPENLNISRKNLIISLETILETVNKCKANVLYFSIAGDDLYGWFLQPQKGIVRFNSQKIEESLLKIMPEKLSSSDNSSKDNLLEKYVNLVRDSLGVNIDNNAQENDNSGWRSSSENLLDDIANERPGFLRMVNRNHLMNSSNYSLSSLFSLGSVGGSSLQGSTRSFQGSSRALPPWQGPSCLHNLYNLLLEPFDDLIPTGSTVSRVGKKELIIVLENDLYLVPFAVLRSGKEDGEYLSERCSILTAPSLQSLKYKLNFKNKNIPNKEQTEALVIGSTSSQEAALVADMLQAKLCTSTKDAVISELPKADCVHFVANINWKLGAIIFSNMDLAHGPDQTRGSVAESIEDSNIEFVRETGENSDFSLTAVDILKMKLNAKIVVINSYSSAGPVNGNGISSLANSWLLSGAGAVLISLWPIPETASKILLRAFYSGLLQGVRAARALADAMQTVKLSKHFAAPVNWAGFLLLGSPNVRLSNKVVLMGKALCELMRSPDKCRDALRVCLHLVEKSLQRIHRGQRNAMYTTQKSIENKAGNVNGWKDLLIAVGFRFEPAANGIQSSVFFPQSDPEDRLSQLSASLQALLGLTPSTLIALSKLVYSSSDVADDIIAVIRKVLIQYPSKSTSDIDISIEVPLSVRLWRTSGCHELLASLGFDLTEVGQDQVILKNGKQANRRNCQFALQALLALFDTQEAPKSLGVDSSSTESLNEESRSESNHLESNQALNSLHQGRSISPAGTVKSASSFITSPPLPIQHAPILSGNSAFTYVKRRGEPDGGGNEDSISKNNVAQCSNTLYPNFDNSLANTTDSEQSDGYISQTLYKTKAPRLGYSSLRGPVKVKVTRPGGGGESDAAFTPSPPVTQNSVEPNVSMALAHQTRIRNLYSSNLGYLCEKTIPEFNIPSTLMRRPDSSSSAGSDWEVSGHATVLRRSTNHCQNLPLVENLKPLAPLSPIYNNMGNSAVLVAHMIKNSGNLLESASSDSEGALKMTAHPTIGLRGKSKIKMGGGNHHALQNQADHGNFIDKLSVRTEVSNILSNESEKRQLNNQDNIEPSKLFLPPTTDNEIIFSNNQNFKTMKDSLKSSTKSIQDSILRHMNREMTPSISEVYHERNLGLGLAPPLSKLLLNCDEGDVKIPTSSIKSIVDSVIEMDINKNNSNPKDVCILCNEKIDCTCRCKGNSTALKMPIHKPWLSNVPSSIVKASDLTTADILERQNNKIKKVTNDSTLLKDINSSKFEENPTIKYGFEFTARRDEGDGRSVADSQCSSTYKTDTNNLQKNLKMLPKPKLGKNI